MRTAFINALTELAKNDKDVVLITGDLGFGTFEPFEERFPGQYFNVGIAEQSMIGIASGLAKAGKKVFVYSIGNFVTLRCLEQIRNDACYHNLNVNLVSQGGGFTYGALGMSHHATEDLAIMRAVPNIEVVVPSNAKNSYEAVMQLANRSGVSYLRLEKGGLPFSSVSELVIGRPNLIKSGDNILLVASGSILEEALIASDKTSLNVGVLDLHTLKPLDEVELARILKEYSLIISIEEHQKAGGVGSLLLEVISDYEVDVKVKRVGINNELISLVGDQKYLRQSLSIDSNAITKIINEYKL